MSNSLKDIVSRIAGSPRATLGDYESATGGGMGTGTDGVSTGMSGAFGVSYDVGVHESKVSQVLFKSEAPVYKVVKISPDLCLGFLKGNLSFCRKSQDECGAKHGGEGSIQFAVEALALAKSPTTAFGPPLLETEVLESDLVEHVLSSRVTFADWNLTCSQIRKLESPVSLEDLMEEQEHSRKAKEHVQTPRKAKSKSKMDSDDWYTQEDDEESVQPFEKSSTFILEDPLNGRPVADRVTVIEAFLAESTVDQKTISKTTGLMLKEAKVVQDYHVTVMNEITSQVGLKSKKFPAVFDGPSLWSTIESLGQYVSSIDSDVAGVVERVLNSKQTHLATGIIDEIREEFVLEKDWNTLLENFAIYMDDEAKDKEVYHKALSACTTRLDALEKRVAKGSGPAASTRSRSSFDPFQKASLQFGQPDPQSETVLDLNSRLESLERTVRLLKGSDTGEKIVRFGGLGFTTISDSGIWLDANPEGIQFGFFIDVYNICTLVVRSLLERSMEN